MQQLFPPSIQSSMQPFPTVPSWRKSDAVLLEIQILFASMCVILALPAEVACTILTLYLKLRHVAKLDSALCNRKLRVEFLATAYGQQAVYSMQASRRLADKIATWCITRRARMYGFYMSATTLSDRFLELVGASVRWITDSDAALCKYPLSQIEHMTQHCPNVDQLALHKLDNRFPIDDTLLMLVQSWPQLRSMNLWCVNITSQGLTRVLSQCTRLKNLDVVLPELLLPVEIAIASLVMLDAVNVVLSDTVLVAIGQRCPRLRALVLRSPILYKTDPVSAVGVRAILEGCLLLQTTTLAQKWAGDPALRVELVRRSDHTELSVGDWVGMDDSLAQEVLKVSPNLLHLRCSHYYTSYPADRTIWLTDATLAVCAQYCPRLEVLDLGFCPRLTVDGLITALRRLGARLQTLSIRGCIQLAGAVAAIGQHCPQLRSISVPVGDRVGDEDVVALAEGCPLLEDVDLCCTGMTDTAVAALAKHCPKLTTLRLWNCRHITIAAACIMAEHCANLRNLMMPRRLREEGKQLDLAFNSGKVRLHYA